MFKFIEKSDISNLRKEAKKAKLIKGFEKHARQMANEGRFGTTIDSVMRAAGVREFNQSFIDYLHEKGFTCADTFEEMNEKDGTIVWDTAKEGLAHDIQVLTNACIKQCLDNLKIIMSEAINSDPYISKLEVQENHLIPGARRVLIHMGYDVIRTKRTVNGYAIYEIEL